MRATGAAHDVRLRHFRNRGLNIAHWYRPDHMATLVADDLSLSPAQLDDQTSAAIRAKIHAE